MVGKRRRVWLLVASDPGREQIKHPARLADHHQGNRWGRRPEPLIYVSAGA